MLSFSINDNYKYFSRVGLQISLTLNFDWK